MSIYLQNMTAGGGGEGRGRCDLPVFESKFGVSI